MTRVRLVVLALAVGCAAEPTTSTTTTSTSTSTTTTTSVSTTTSLPSEPVTDQATAERALRDRGVDPDALSREIAEKMRQRFKPAQ